VPTTVRYPELPLGAVTHNGPVTRGFDYFFGVKAQAKNVFTFFENDRIVQSTPPVDTLPLITKSACDLIGERAKKPEPFFLYLALTSPHVPIVPNGDWKGKSGIGDYGDFVMETDWAVGQVLAALDKSGLAENTLVFFTSDNGCSRAAKIDQLEKLGHYASGPFRGYKSDIWDGGHHVAFFARWPGVVKPGSKCTQLVCHTDLMATCADILGAKLDDHTGEDSFSMLPLLKGGNTPIRDYVVHHSIFGMFAIRDAQWKLELCPGSGGWESPKDSEAFAEKLPPIQLYNMSSDISEKANQQEVHPEIVKRLFAMLKKIVADGRSTPGPLGKNDVTVDIYKSPATKAKLDTME
jgi:arylsulfatase A